MLIMHAMLKAEYDYMNSLSALVSSTGASTRSFQERKRTVGPVGPVEPTYMS